MKFKSTAAIWVARTITFDQIRNGYKLKESERICQRQEIKSVDKPSNADLIKYTVKCFTDRSVQFPHSK